MTLRRRRKKENAMGRVQELRGSRTRLPKAWDLQTALSHLECARAALNCAKASVAGAYVEQALHHCRLELAAMPRSQGPDKL